MNFNYQSISLASKQVYTIKQWVSSIPFLIIYLSVLFCSLFFNWNKWVFRSAICLLIIRIALLLFKTFIASKLLYKHTKFAISEEFVAIQTGILTIHHIIIPVAKIQGVVTEQNLTMTRYTVKSISIATMNGIAEIPYLNEKDADSIQAEIAVLAKIKEPY